MTHTSLEDLNKKLQQGKSKVEVGGTYYHYKSPEQYYVVESVGLIEESEEVCVVYRALYDKGIVWVRTLVNFTEETGNGPRFIKVE